MIRLPPFLRASAPKATDLTVTIRLRRAWLEERERERNKTHPGQPRRPCNSRPHLADQDKAIAASPYRHCDAQTKTPPPL